MVEKLKIPEGSKIKFELHGAGNIQIVKTAEANEDMEIISNSILLIDNGLFCVNNVNSFRKINDREFVVEIYLQDALVVKDSIFYNSLSDLD